MAIALVCLCLIFLAMVVMFFRDYYVRLKVQHLASKKYAAMTTFIEKLAVNTPVSETELTEIAENPSLRIPLFHALKAYNREGAFPIKFYTEEKGAESYMVNWLEFPTELGVAPDEIALVRVIPLDPERQGHYYVFKFKTSKPHWAKNLKWMIGVCGPYDENSKAFDLPRRIFSRFKEIGEINVLDEVKWVHENITK
jgi:hypothetical protein